MAGQPIAEAGQSREVGGAALASVPGPGWGAGLLHVQSGCLAWPAGAAALPGGKATHSSGVLCWIKHIFLKTGCDPSYGTLPAPAVLPQLHLDPLLGARCFHASAGVLARGGTGQAAGARPQVHGRPLPGPRAVLVLTLPWKVLKGSEAELPRGPGLGGRTASHLQPEGRGLVPILPEARGVPRPPP